MKIIAISAGIGATSLALGVLIGIRLTTTTTPTTASPPPAPAERRPSKQAAPTSLLGIVVANAEVKLRAPFAGVLKMMSVGSGDVVAAGAVLAQVDSPEMEGQIAAAEASLRQAEAQSERAARALQAARERRGRTEALAKYVSLEDRSTARHDEHERGAELAAARAVVEERTAIAERLRRQLAEATLRAPFDGVVSQRYVGPLERVNAQEAVLLIAKQGASRVRFAGQPDEMSSLHVSDRVALQVETIAEPLSGVVEAIAPEIDPGSRLVMAEARLDDETPQVHPGLVAHVTKVAARTPASAVAHLRPVETRPLPGRKP